MLFPRLPAYNLHALSAGLNEYIGITFEERNFALVNASVHCVPHQLQFNGQPITTLALQPPSSTNVSSASPFHPFPLALPAQPQWPETPSTILESPAGLSPSCSTEVPAAAQCGEAAVSGATLSSSQQFEFASESSWLDSPSTLHLNDSISSAQSTMGPRRLQPCRELSASGDLASLDQTPPGSGKLNGGRRISADAGDSEHAAALSRLAGHPKASLASLAGLPPITWAQAADRNSAGVKPSEPQLGPAAADAAAGVTTNLPSQGQQQASSSPEQQQPGPRMDQEFQNSLYAQSPQASGAQECNGAAAPSSASIVSNELGSATPRSSKLSSSNSKIQGSDARDAASTATSGQVGASRPSYRQPAVAPGASTTVRASPSYRSGGGSPAKRPKRKTLLPAEIRPAAAHILAESHQAMATFLEGLPKDCLWINLDR